MKLVSPAHRGRTWRCKWPGRPAPAARPRCWPPCSAGRALGRLDRGHRPPRRRPQLGRLRIGCIRPDVTQGQHQNCPAGVGVGVHDDEGQLSASYHQVVLRREGRSPRGGRRHTRTRPATVAAGAVVCSGFDDVVATPARPQVFEAHVVTPRLLSPALSPKPCWARLSSGRPLGADLGRNFEHEVWDRHATLGLAVPPAAVHPRPRARRHVSRRPPRAHRGSWPAWRGGSEHPASPRSCRQSPAGQLRRTLSATLWA